MQKVGFIKEDFFDILRAALYSILLTIGGVLVFALAIKAWDMSNTVITVFNMANKVMALFFAMFLGIRTKAKGFFKGISVGALYLILTLIIFTALNRGYDSDFLSVFDIIFTLIVSIIICLARVNI